VLPLGPKRQVFCSHGGLARKFDHVSVKGSVPTQNSFLSVNDPERPSTLYSNQRAKQESSANAHTMGRHFTRVAIYSRISNDPQGIKPAEFADTRLKAGVNRPVFCDGDTDLPNADDTLTLRIKGAVAMN
jgi:hypothetical protein